MNRTCSHGVSPAARTEHGVGVGVDPGGGDVPEVPAHGVEDFFVRAGTLPEGLGVGVEAAGGQVVREVDERGHAREPDPEIVVHAELQRLVQVADPLDDPPSDEGGRAGR